MDGTVEPLSQLNKKQAFSVSLRGSLAQKYLDYQTDEQDTREFIEHLLESSDKSLVKRLDGKTVIIGLRSEIGQFFPDW